MNAPMLSEFRGVVLEMVETAGCGRGVAWGVNAAVLLLHELPDGSSHYDWMIQRPGRGQLITFRLSQRIDQAPPHQFLGQRLPDHRPEYLGYEGEVSGNRGVVTRLSEGKLDIEVDIHGHFRVSGMMGMTRGAFDGRLQPDGRWSFTYRPER
jgi:hypothetical protein